MLNEYRDVIMMSAVIFTPTFFALVLLLFPKGSEEGMKYWSLLGTVITLVLSLFLFIDYLKVLDENKSLPDNAHLMYRTDQDNIDALGHQPTKSLDLVARYPWIQRFNIEYYLGIDGISMALILLTTLISCLGMIASWNINKAVKGYCALYLLLETGMIGTFMALDFVLFYVFWEIMLLPMYFLIGIWGGPRREYAAIKFFLYTLLGSVLILVAILAFYFTDLKPMVGVMEKADANLQQQVKAEDQTTEAYKSAQTYHHEVQAVQALAKDREQATEINTFDIMLLHKVGRESTRLQVEIDRLQAEYDSLAFYTGDNAEEIQAKAKAELEEVQARQPFSRSLQITMFLLLAIGFAIKVPVFPFHTWLPDAHVEAPTPISMILAGVLLKMGGYGILRIAYPICPLAAYELAWWIGLFGVINIVYGAFAAMAQTDFKKLVAYSSISHMGYVILGIAVWTSLDRYQYWGWGMNGAMFQMLAHGVTSAGMFFLVGVIYDRAHHRDLSKFGGLNNSMPLYSGLSALIFFGAMGLPGLCGFVGEFFTILATWNFSTDAFPASGKLFAVLAAATVVLTAAYILWTVQRVFLGENPKYHGLPDITLRELICAVPLVGLTVLMGVWPDSVLQWMEPSVTGLVKQLAGTFGT